MVSEASVTVGTVIKESVPKTLTFVAWYLELGAARVVLYFDDPEDPAIPHLLSEPRVSIVRCTPDFWHERKLDPAVRFTKRQNAALTHGFRSATTDWYLAVDGDEFLHLAEGDLGRFAGAIAPEVRSVRFCAAEAVGQVGATRYFRVPVGRDVLRDIYGGDAAWLLRARGGLMGHSIGKSMTRCGTPVAGLRQHFAVDPKGQAIDDLAVGPSQDAVLLHYLATSFENWREKLAWRRQSWGFSPRVAERLDRLQGEDSEAELRQLYERVHVLDATRLLELCARGGALGLEIDPGAIGRRRFPDLFPATDG